MTKMDVSASVKNAGHTQEIFYQNAGNMQDIAGHGLEVQYIAGHEGHSRDQVILQKMPASSIRSDNRGPDITLGPSTILWPN